MRITISDVRTTIDRINRTAGFSDDQIKNGCYETSGMYHLQGAYGGWTLHKNCKGGGVDSVFPGYHTKRELYDKMQALLTGARGL